MTTDKYTFLAMELENRDETKDKADFIKRMIKTERHSIFEKTKVNVMANAFHYLDSYGGEDLQLDEIEEWFAKAKSEIIKELNDGSSESDVE